MRAMSRLIWLKTETLDDLIDGEPKPPSPILLKSKPPSPIILKSKPPAFGGATRPSTPEPGSGIKEG